MAKADFTSKTASTAPVADPCAGLWLPRHIKLRNQTLAAQGFTLRVEKRGYIENRFLFKYQGPKELFISSGIVRGDFQFPNGHVPCRRGIKQFYGVGDIEAA